MLDRAPVPSFPAQMTNAQDLSRGVLVSLFICAVKHVLDRAGHVAEILRAAYHEAVAAYDVADRDLSRRHPSNNHSFHTPCTVFHRCGQGTGYYLIESDRL